MAASATLSSGIGAPVRAADDMRICGVVANYVPATSLLPGVLSIGGLQLLTAPGTTLSSNVQPGANLCMAADTNGTGQIINAAFSPNTTGTVSTCGVVTAYTPADSDSGGSLTIGGSTLPTAAGSNLPSTLSAGDDVCGQFTINGFGEVTNGTVGANTNGSLRTCGVVSHLFAGDADSTGSLTIGGITRVLAAGSQLPSIVQEGADICTDLTLNGLGQVSDGTAQANVGTTSVICGLVSHYSASGPTNTGNVIIDGVAQPIAPTATIDGVFDTAQFARVNVTRNPLGQITDASLLEAGSSSDVCEPADGPLDGTPPLSGSPGPEAPGATSSPSPTDGPDPVGDGTDDPSGSGRAPVDDGCEPIDADGALGGGLLPDPSSVARAGGAILSSAVPFGALLAGSMGFALWRRRFAGGES